MQILKKGLFMLLVAAMLASCSSSKKSTSRSGRVIVVEDGKNVRIGSAKKDNGLHKGWYKNTNNPHHPNTTNPGHTRKKKGSAVIVTNTSPSKTAPPKKGKQKGKGKKS